MANSSLAVSSSLAVCGGVGVGGHPAGQLVEGGGEGGQFC